MPHGKWNIKFFSISNNVEEEFEDNQLGDENP